MRVLPEIPVSRMIPFIEEDCPYGDITSEVILDEQPCRAHIISRQELILAGLTEIIVLFRHYGVTAESEVQDGDKIPENTIILSLCGTAQVILRIERTALNIIGRMSGIASETSRIQKRVTAINPSCRIAATRKTAPGLRIFDKKACIIGGADHHRFSLSDAILIKDTHRALIPLAEAIRRAKAASMYHRIEAEVESPEEAVEAAQAGAEIILLDNMSPATIQKTLDILGEEGLRQKVIIELSGGITPETIDEYAALGAERISLGMLTHSVRNADFSLKILQ